MPYETYVPERGHHVELLFDPRSKKVGLKPRRKPTKASYKLLPSPQSGNRYYVSAGSFLEHYGIGAKKAKSQEASWNKRTGVAEFSVK
ncbi:MAG: hypothetical protein ACREX3_20765 [Gammaproteobacteria bacterium]